MVDTGGTSATKSMGFIAKLRDWLDIWPTHVLEPDELAEAKLFERWFATNWWKLLIPEAVLMLLLAFSLNVLVPKTSVLGWFWVVLAIGVALEMSFLIAYFGYRRYARRYSFRKQLLWGTLGAATGVAGALIGIAAGSTKSLYAELLDGRLWAFLVVLCTIAVVIGLLMTLIAKLRLTQADLKLEKVSADAERERLAKRNAEAELKLMQAQVEPHFLYNTLANLRYLIQSGSPQALDMTDHLIDYLRVSLPSFRSDFTTLGREVELSRAYLAIMEIRMGGKLRWNIDVPHALTDVKLPPLMLLTLIENAVKHGVGRATDGGDIRISASRDGEHVVIVVADTGAGLGHTLSTSATKPKGSGVGLANVRERLKAVYGDAATLALASNQPRGVVATISLRQYED